MLTEKHWMTAETFILYVGLIIDYAPSHSKAEMDKWINQLNGLTRVLQACISQVI